MRHPILLGLALAGVGIGGYVVWRIVQAHAAGSGAASLSTGTPASLAVKSTATPTTTAQRTASARTASTLGTRSNATPTASGPSPDTLYFGETLYRRWNSPSSPSVAGLWYENSYWIPA